MKYREVLGIVIDRSVGIGKRNASIRSKMVIESVKYSADISIGSVEAARQWAHATFGNRYHIERVAPWASDKDDYIVELESTYTNVDSFLLAYGSRAEEVLMGLYKMFYPETKKSEKKEPPLDLVGEES